MFYSGSVTGNLRLIEIIQEYSHQFLYIFIRYLMDSVERNAIKIFIKMTLFRDQRGVETEEMEILSCLQICNSSCFYAQ